MVPENLQPSDKSLKTLKWDAFVEKIGIWGDLDFKKNGFVDQIDTAKDSTDYLWHTIRFFFLLAQNIFDIKFFFQTIYVSLHHIVNE